jgi:hypothetical protein
MNYFNPKDGKINEKIAEIITCTIIVLIVMGISAILILFLKGK